MFTEVIQQLTTDYCNAESQLNHLRPGPLPSRNAILATLDATKNLLFPDHRLNQQVRTDGLAYAMGGWVAQLHEKLSVQIFLARSYTQHGASADGRARAQADALTFIHQLPGLRASLALDVQAALDGDPAAKSSDEIIFCYPGFAAIATYRIAHELFRLDIPLLPRIMTEYAHSRTGCDIHPGARIGPSFFIDHATGVVIGETTIIGERVKLYQGVTLGALSFPKDEHGNLLRNTKRHPTIEDDVVIYAGATVLGGETTIGRGSVIGGSCWITHSIPAGTRVLLQEPHMRVTGARTPTTPYEPDWCI
jgi:serine O-acetyltransferase